MTVSRPAVAFQFSLIAHDAKPHWSSNVQCLIPTGYWGVTSFPGLNLLLWSILQQRKSAISFWFILIMIEIRGDPPATSHCHVSFHIDFSLCNPVQLLTIGNFVAWYEVLLFYDISVWRYTCKEMSWSIFRSTRDGSLMRLAGCCVNPDRHETVKWLIRHGTCMDRRGWWMFAHV